LWVAKSISFPVYLAKRKMELGKRIKMRLNPDPNPGKLLKIAKNIGRRRGTTKLPSFQSLGETL